MNTYITVGHINPDNYQDVGPYESEEAAKAILNRLPEFSYYYNDSHDMDRDEWHASGVGKSEGCVLFLTTNPYQPVPAKSLAEIIHWL